MNWSSRNDTASRRPARSSVSNSFAYGNWGTNRRIKPTWLTTPAASTASAIRVADAASNASGFSQNTATPRCAAAATSRSCSDVQVVMNAASTRSKSSASETASAPTRPANAPARSVSGSCTATTRWSVALCLRNQLWVRAMNPVPMNPMRTVMAPVLLMVSADAISNHSVVDQAAVVEVDGGELGLLGPVVLGVLPLGLVAALGHQVLAAHQIARVEVVGVDPRAELHVRVLRSQLWGHLGGPELVHVVQQAAHEVAEEVGAQGPAGPEVAEHPQQVRDAGEHH